MSQLPRVALLVEMSGVHGRHILQGVTQYLRSHRAWTLLLEHGAIGPRLPHWFETCQVDGVISRWSGSHVSEALRELDVPVVDVSSRHPSFGLPRITSDDLAVGSLGAEHLLGRRLRSFAFYGLKGELWSTRRRDGFLETVSRAGYQAQVFETPPLGHHQRQSEGDMARLDRWLSMLPRPAGVMVCKDLHGPYVLDACKRSGLRIPDEVALIGADDDVLLCELNTPPLSSVIGNPERIGYESAALLDRLMAGGEAGCDERLIPPLGVATRLSTDVLAIDDERVVAAIRYIHANACHGITTSDVLDHVSLSRTNLDRLFQKYVLRSPHAEIRAAQLGRAKQLLSETDHSIHRIAELVGFNHTEYFHFAFKREFGQTPGRFRQETRPADPRSVGRGGQREGKTLVDCPPNPGPVLMN
jgi:LacI family transcriptional regulator, galactose operon repressor